MQECIIEIPKNSFIKYEMENNTRKLIESVSSKKGTTEAALKILEKKNTGLYKIMKDAVYAAKKRANSLSKLN